MVHCHTVYSDGKHTVEQMARAAEEMGMRYITITDHSPTAGYANGLNLDRLHRQWEEIDRVQQKVAIRLLRGSEVDILKDGALDWPDRVLEQMDVVVASIHNRYGLGEDEMTRRVVRGLRHPLFKVWGHALGRYVLRRPPIAVRIDEILDAAAASRVAIEINGNPNRLDMEPRYVRAGAAPRPALHAVGGRALDVGAAPPALGGGHGAPGRADEGRRAQHAGGGRVRGSGAAVGAAGTEPLTPRIFLLSPASAGGERARLVFNPAARFELAQRLRTRRRRDAGRGVHVPQRPLLPRQAAVRAGLRNPPAGVDGIHVITPSRGLRPPWDKTTLVTLSAYAKVDIDLRDPRYTKPLLRDVREAGEGARAASRGARWCSWAASPAASTWSCCPLPSARACASHPTSWAAAT